MPRWLISSFLSFLSLKDTPHNHFAIILSDLVNLARFSGILYIPLEQSNCLNLFGTLNKIHFFQHFGNGLEAGQKLLNSLALQLKHKHHIFTLQQKDTPFHHNWCQLIELTPCWLNSNSSNFFSPTPSTYHITKVAEFISVLKFCNTINKYKLTG